MSLPLPMTWQLTLPPEQSAETPPAVAVHAWPFDWTLHVARSAQLMVQSVVHTNEQVSPAPHEQSEGHCFGGGGGWPELDELPPVEDEAEPDELAPSVTVFGPASAPGGTMSQSCEHASTPTKHNAPTDTERTDRAYGIGVPTKSKLAMERSGHRFVEVNAPVVEALSAP